MCGIFGMVGNVPNRQTLAASLCVLNAARGHHSAGIATCDENLRTRIFKRAWTPERFARSKKFRQIAEAPARVLIGHTRWATHGAVSNANAHPFKSGGTIGTHNGMVQNLAGVKRYCGGADFPVDSQYLVYLLDLYGHLGPADGQLNLAYFGPKDTADLRLVRWDNPLHVAFVNGSKGLVYSSAGSDLKKAMSIAGLRGKVEEFPDEQSGAVTIGHDGIVSIELGPVPFDNCPETINAYQKGSDYGYWFKTGGIKDYKGVEYFKADDGTWKQEISRNRKFHEISDEDWETLFPRGGQ